MSDTRYCLCCDEQVPFGLVERNARREVICNYCGFTLDIEKFSEMRQADSKGYTLVADDSRYTRKIIEDLVIEKKFSSDVMSFENGLELVTAYSKFLAESKPVDVAIIDLNMPVMNGLTAAKAIRTIEAQQKIPFVPIVFFSAEKADDDLKEQMQSLEPAYYVNKGSDPDPDKLAGRVEYLLGYLRDRFGRQPE
jgi:CheY-like chemotaxis protein